MFDDLRGDLQSMAREVLGDAIRTAVERSSTQNRKWLGWPLNPL